MSDFDPKELRRLSEAAPGDTWHADTAPWFGLRWGVRRVHDELRDKCGGHEDDNHYAYDPDADSLSELDTWADAVREGGA